MFYKIFVWLLLVLAAAGAVGVFFLWIFACGMSDAPHTCSLPFLGYIN